MNKATKITSQQVIEPLKVKMYELLLAHKKALKTIEERRDELDDVAADWIIGIKMNIQS